MRDKKEFFRIVKKLVTGFHLDISDVELREKAALLYDDMGFIGLSNEAFDSAVDTFRFKTEGSNFNKLPSTGDFIKLLGLQPKTVEQLAAEQALYVFSSIPDMQLKSQIIFSDPVTNYVLNAYTGGISAFVWDHNPTNPNVKDVTWSQKKFEKDYVSAHELGLKKLDSLVFTNNSKLLGKKMFGDKQQCLANMEAHKALPTSAASKLIADTTNKMRK